MRTLLSKIQYKSFEPGEFTDISSRNYAETIRLIEAFPWSSERENIVIDLTNPSVTLEGTADFLKLALYFNGKWVLYYLNSENILFAKTCLVLAEAYPYIRKFFDEDDFPVSDFKKQPNRSKSNRLHFVTQDFRYTVTPRRIRQFLLSNSGLSVSLFVIINIFYLSDAGQSLHFWGILLMIGLLILFGGGINLLLFLNYYWFSRNRILVLSQGNDQFMYGPVSDPVAYDKKQISEINVVGFTYIRSPILRFYVLWIRFHDQQKIQISGLMLDQTAMLRKFEGLPITEEDALPIMHK